MQEAQLKTPSIFQNLTSRYASEVAGTRNSLINKLSSINQAFSIPIQNLLFSRSGENTTAILGELYPWMIQEGFNIDKVAVEKVASSWLALYLHSVIVDKILDENENLPPATILSNSLLAKEGVLSLQKIVTGTKYEKMVDDFFNQSAEHELLDVLKKESTNSAEKTAIAVGKNGLVLACAAALAATEVTNEVKQTAIINFTRELILVLQYIDDISDYYEDFENKNFSYLLSKCVEELPNTLDVNSQKELIIKLIDSNALSNTLLEIRKSLVTLKEQLDSSGQASPEIKLFFSDLSLTILRFEEQLNELALPLNKNYPTEQITLIVDKTQLNINSIFAQS